MVHYVNSVSIWPCVVASKTCVLIWFCFFFQAEDGILDLVRSRGLGDVYKRQVLDAHGALAELLDTLGS